MQKIYISFPVLIFFVTVVNESQTIYKFTDSSWASEIAWYTTKSYELTVLRDIASGLPDHSEIWKESRQSFLPKCLSKMYI